jgi:hypothetical protein
LSAKLDEPMSFPKAASEIGWRNGSKDACGRRLLRRCMVREREIGRKFVVRDRGGRPIRVTIGDLHRYLPECRPSRVEALAESIRPYVTAMDARTAEVVLEQIELTVQPQIDKLDNRVVVIEKWKALTQKYLAEAMGLFA